MALLDTLFGMQTADPLPSQIDDEEMRRAIAERVRQAQTGPITTGPQQAPEPAPQLPEPAPLRDYASQGAPYSMSAAPPAPAPVAASPAAPATQAQAQARRVTAGDRMAAFARGYRDGGLIGAVAAAGEGVDRQIENHNATVRTLMQRGGMNTDEAKAVASNPTLLQAMLPHIYRPKTQVINNRLVDERGNVVADLSDTARQGPEIKTVKTPDGDEVSVTWDAASKTWRPFGPIEGAGGAAAPSGGAPVPTAVPPAPPGANKAEWRKGYTSEMAKSTATANAALPGAIAQTERLITSIEAVEKDPQLGKVIGPIDANTPTFLPASKRVESRLNEIEKQSFMQAFESLKGAGAITEQEGKAAQQSLNRLSARDVSEADYLRALAEFKSNVKTMLDTAKVKAGRMTPDQASARREARDAIQRGAPANLVAQRLQENGFDGSGL